MITALHALDAPRIHALAAAFAAAAPDEEKPEPVPSAHDTVMPIGTDF